MSSSSKAETHETPSAAEVLRVAAIEGVILVRYVTPSLSGGTDRVDSVYLTTTTGQLQKPEFRSGRKVVLRNYSPPPNSYVKPEETRPGSAPFDAETSRGTIRPPGGKTIGSLSDITTTPGSAKGGQDKFETALGSTTAATDKNEQKDGDAPPK